MSQLNIKDGHILDPGNKDKIYKSRGTGAETAASKAKTNKDKEFNKDMFLKLLAAEMQYQDPLAPTQNSEYVKEMATFSQVEATQNVSKSVDSISASNLIGKYVTVSTDQGDVTGMVSAISKKDDGMYVTIDNREFLVDKVTSVKDNAHFEATQIANAFSNMMAKLPNVDRFNLSNEKDLNKVNALYKNMTPYAKQFLSNDTLKKLSELNNKYKELIKDKKKETKPLDKNKENKSIDKKKEDKALKNNPT